MAKLVTALICQNVITDAESNLVSYINVLDRSTIQLPQALPCNLTPITIGSVWERTHEDDTLSFRLQLTRPHGEAEELLTTDPIEFPKPLHRANIRLVGLRVKEEGEHVFKLYSRQGNRWRVRAQLPLTMARQDHDAAGQSGEPPNAVAPPEARKQ